MKKFLTIIAFIALGFLLKPSTIHAYVIEKQYDRTYELNEDYVQITEKKDIKVIQNNLYIPPGSEEGFTIFNPIQNDPDVKEKVQKTLDSIALTDNFGNKLDYTTESTDNGNLQIKIKLNTGIYYNQTYSINLSYRSYGLVIKSGALRDLYIPAFAKDYVFEDDQSKETISTTIRVPKIYGTINFVRPTATIQDDGTNRKINLTQDQLLGHTGWIQIGIKQFYSFKISQPYTSSTSIPIVYNSYKLVIPRSTDAGPVNQKVFFTKITPEPYQIVEDKDGNLIATFRVPATDNGNIEIEGYAELDENNSVDYKTSGNLSDIPASIVANNTMPAKYWESDSQEIKDAAAQIKGTETNVYKLIAKTYEYVVGKIDYSEVKKFGLNQRQGALATLKGGAAVCMEYSDLFIALMRAMGVPARAAFGTGYSALDYTTSSSDAINHQWAEVYVPGINSWIGVDTTWGENGTEIIGGDLNHFYSHVASVNPETPSTTEVTFYGKDGKFSERTMQVMADCNFSQIWRKKPQKR